MPDPVTLTLTADEARLLRDLLDTWRQDCLSLAAGSFGRRKGTCTRLAKEAEALAARLDPPPAPADNS